MWGILRDQAYGNRPHTEDKLKESIQIVVSNFTSRIKWAMNMLQVMCVCKPKQTTSNTSFMYSVYRSY